MHTRYDGLGRLATVTQSGNGVAEKRVDFTYTDTGWLSTITRYADVEGTSKVATSVYAYSEDLARLESLVHTINNTNQDVIEYAYTHEADGQIASIDSSEDGLYEYTYDNQGQLTDVALDDGGGAETIEHYEYDAAGNRTASTVGGVTTSYTTIAYNRVGTSDDGTDVIVYGYDAEGNLVFQFVDEDESGDFTTGDTGVTEYEWDHRNRLVSVTNYATYADWLGGASSQEVDYAYDFLNRLVARTIDADGAGAASSATSEYFVYDSDDLATTAYLLDHTASDDGAVPLGADADLDAGQIVLQLDAAGAPTHRYLWGPAVDMLLADEVVDNGGAEDVAWMLGDHQNSVRDIVLKTGAEWAVENHLTYAATGEILDESGQTDSAFAWTGRYLDAATAKQYNTTRWYDLALARWLSEDPISFAGDLGNLYRYCGNDPVNAVDPSGTKVYWCVRDLDKVVLGNHHFLVVVPDNPNDFPNEKLLDLYGGERGFTLCGNKSEDGSYLLVFVRNTKADIAATREMNDPEKYKASSQK